MVFTLVFDQHGCKIIVYCSTVIYSTCKIQLAQPQSTFEYYECHTRILIFSYVNLDLFFISRFSTLGLGTIAMLGDMLRGSSVLRFIF